MLKSLYPDEHVHSAFDIDYGRLASLGYRGLIFDIDQTLVPHGYDSTPEVDALFARIRDLGFKVAFLSNNDEERVRRFLRNIDAPFVCDAEKPDLDGFEKAVELLGLPKERIACVGDQLFTDVLGANIVGLYSIIVDFIPEPGETALGKRRAFERALLDLYGAEKRLGLNTRGLENAELFANVHRFANHDINFCDISPAAYAVSLRKEIILRHLQNLTATCTFALDRKQRLLPNVVSTHTSGLIKHGPGIDPELQYNKAVNIELACKQMSGVVVHPGEVFSFWRAVGNTTPRRGYKAGREIIGGTIQPGIGGGLCNLGNTLHWVVLHSPLTVVEFHNHSDALAPDHGPRVPFSTGTSVSYNNIDYRFRNDTDQDVQLVLWCADETLFAELRSERPFPWEYRLVEEDHRFRREGAKYYRVSKIYRETLDTQTGELLARELVLDNHSEVMFDYDLIPADQIRDE